VPPGHFHFTIPAEPALGVFWRGGRFQMPKKMDYKTTHPLRESYDRLADEYATRIFNELQHKPLDRELLSRFAAEVASDGEICDMGCGPGHIARYLPDPEVNVFGLDLSPGMLRQARRLSPDISSHEGNRLALNLLRESLAGIAAFYPIVNIPGESLSLVFREMERVLRSGGILFLAFHAGDETLREDQLWGSGFRWISSFFNRQRFSAVSKTQALSLKMSSSEGLMPRGGIPNRTGI
jgi:SAM-dependent methyltransferase